MSTIKIVIAAFGIVLLAASCAASPLTPRESLNKSEDSRLLRSSPW